MNLQEHITKQALQYDGSEGKGANTLYGHKLIQMVVDESHVDEEEGEYSFLKCPADSPCGADCAKLIDAAMVLMAHIDPCVSEFDADELWRSTIHGCLTFYYG